MKHKYFVLGASFILFSFILFCPLLYPQAGSVELKDGGGILISSHASITEAYNAIPDPVTQAYIIELLVLYNGSAETFPINISERAGTSPTNTITLRPDGGGIMIVTSISNNPVINLNGIDYFIIDGRVGGIGGTPDLLVENTITSGTSSNTINITNGATNNVVRYCYVMNSTQNTAGPRTLIFGNSTTTGNDNNIIEYNEIIGGRSGIGMVGSAGILNSGNIIRNNKIHEFGFAGIWMLQNGQNTTIEENEIFQTSGISTTASYGINLGASGTNGENTISKNNIYNIRHSSTSTSASIRGIYGTLAVGSTLNINNNFISLTLDNQNTSSTTGIHVLGSNAFTANIFFNTVRIGGNQSGGTSGNIVSAGIQQSNTSTSTVYNLKNNIVINNRTGGTAGVIHSGLNMAVVPTTLDVDYNVYFSDGGAGAFPVSWNGITYNDLTTYQVAVSPHEQNSIFKNVTFVSNTDLHLSGLSNGDFDLAGIPISGITEDIDGDVRHAQFPYRGGDEADPLPIELTAFTASVVDNSVTLSWTTATELNNVGFNIERSQTESSWQVIGFVPGFGTSVKPKTYSFTDADLSPGNYYYRIKQIDFNGSYSFYELGYAVEISLPDKFELAQNYPNPFNPTTKIDYSIAKETNVQLLFFNSIGEEVALMVNETQQPGKYTINFDASSLSSGVYFYKLIAGDFNSIKKMLLVK